MALEVVPCAVSPESPMPQAHLQLSPAVAVIYVTPAKTPRNLRQGLQHAGATRYGAQDSIQLCRLSSKKATP